MVLERVMVALKNDEIRLMGLYGMPGVGKTMLVEALSQQAKEELLFDEVVTVSLSSQNLDLRTIQDDVAMQLDLMLEESESDISRAESISQRLLQHRNVLVVLDNLWERVELEKLGIPLRNKRRCCCKVVFTTRDQNVCDEMETDEKIQVVVLSGEDSSSLFRQNAGVDELPSSSDFQAAATDVLNECKGLPVACSTSSMEDSTETTSASSSSPVFCMDIFFEILTRVSLQTLVPCRLVCKEWGALSYESYFRNLHCERRGFLSGYYIQSLTRNKYSSTFVSMNTFPSTSNSALGFLPVCDPRIVASSNQGLFCCVSECTRIPQFYVCKPATKEWRRIPRPKTRYFSYNFAMKVQPNSANFIIVRLSNPHGSIYKHRRWQHILQCEVFDSKYNKWRRSHGIELPHCVFLSNGPAISSNGAFHWLTTAKNIFAFDIAQEHWNIISVPEEVVLDPDWKQLQLVKYEGRLALASKEKEWMELWVLQHYAERVWQKKRRVKLEPLANDNLVDLYTSDVAFATAGLTKVMWYNYNHRNTTEANIKDYIYEIFPFQSNSEKVFQSI